MYRRRFLQTLNFMGASVILPQFEGYDQGSSIMAQTAKQLFNAPTYAVEVANSGWDIPKVGIVAVGGSGCAILSSLAGRLPYLRLSIAIDTDVSALQWVKADRKILVGDGMTPALNSGLVRLLGLSSIAEIADAIAGLDMVFLVTDMGDTAGSHIAPIVARMLREQDILTLAFATLPFNFESQQLKQIAQSGIHELRVHVNALLRLTTGNIGQLAGKDALFASASSQAPLAFDQLWHSVLNPVCKPSLINIDFEDLRHLILSHQGGCAFGFGSSSGVNSAEAAALNAIDHPLLGLSRLQQASGVLVVIKAPPGVLKLGDAVSALKSIRKQLPQDPWIVWSTYYATHLGNEITVSVLANGIKEI